LASSLDDPQLTSLMRQKIYTYILVRDMFEELELAVGSFAEYRGTERFHDLLDGDRRSRQLVLSGAIR
jgi:hypothetical protein